MQTQAFSSFTHDDELQNWAQGSKLFLLLLPMTMNCRTEHKVASRLGNKQRGRRRKETVHDSTRHWPKDMHIRKIAAAHFSEMEKNKTTKKAEKDTARGKCQPLLSFCVGVLPNANDTKEMICLSLYPRTANSSWSFRLFIYCLCKSM